jgi:hypothetical protein
LQSRGHRRNTDFWAKNGAEAAGGETKTTEMVHENDALCYETTLGCLALKVRQRRNFSRKGAKAQRETPLKTRSALRLCAFAGDKEHF